MELWCKATVVKIVMSCYQFRYLQLISDRCILCLLNKHGQGCTDETSLRSDAVLDT